MFVSQTPRRRRTLGAAYRLSFPSDRFLLGAITADQAARMIFPNPPASPNAGHNMATFDSIVAAAQSGFMSPSYEPGTGGCANVTLGAKAIITSGGKQAAGVLLKIGAATGNPIVLAAGAAAEVASIVFSAIFGHHAKAVAKERSILCAAVPAANATLAAVDSAIAAGQFSPQNGIDALNAMLAGFGQQVAAIQHGADPTAKGECNAACVMLSQLRAIVARKISIYQDMMAPPVPARSSAAAVPGGAVMPSSVLPWAAVAVLAFLILGEV
jgi:hypothetical protein